MAHLRNQQKAHEDKKWAFSFRGETVNITHKFLLLNSMANSSEPRHDKTCLREFPTRPDTNRPAQPQTLAKSLAISAIEYKRYTI